MQEAQKPLFATYVSQLSPESQRVLDLARAEAVTLNHNFIGTEHLLWGLISEGSLNTFFCPLNVTAERIHGGIVFIFERHMQPDALAHLKAPAADVSALQLLTPRSKEAVILAGEEMKSQGEESIRPAHLLLGLMNEGTGIGAGLLRSLGVAFLQVRAALVPVGSHQACSFCGHSGSLIKRLFTAEIEIGLTNPAGTLICDQCVERFHTQLHA